ncbi:hypothetical protein AB0I98_27295 [Streptomyces sp. NPDC050211]
MIDLHRSSGASTPQKVLNRLTMITIMLLSWGFAFWRERFKARRAEAGLL